MTQGQKLIRSNARLHYASQAALCALLGLTLAALWMLGDAALMFAAAGLFGLIALKQHVHEREQARYAARVREYDEEADLAALVRRTPIH